MVKLNALAEVSQLYTLGGIIFRHYFLGTGGSATIKHRCVTHLYGRNAIRQVAGCKLQVAGVSVQANSTVFQFFV